MKSRSILSFSIAISLLFFVYSYTEAANAKVSVLSLTDNSKSLVLSFKIQDAFTKNIEEAILSGIPTTFTFFIEVYRAKRLWRDERVISYKFRHTVRYDNLKEEFEIFLEEDPYKKIVVKDMATVKDVMTKVEDLVTESLLSFVGGERYLVKVKAELKTIKLPFPFKYVLFFVSFWDFETNWHSQSFTVESGRVMVKR